MASVSQIICASCFFPLGIACFFALLATFSGQAFVMVFALRKKFKSASDGGDLFVAFTVIPVRAMFAFVLELMIYGGLSVAAWYFVMATAVRFPYLVTRVLKAVSNGSTNVFAMTVASALPSIVQALRTLIMIGVFALFFPLCCATVAGVPMLFAKWFSLSFKKFFEWGFEAALVQTFGAALTGRIRHLRVFTT